MIRSFNHSSYPRVGDSPLDQQIRTAERARSLGKITEEEFLEAAGEATTIAVAEQSRAFIDIVTELTSEFFGFQRLTKVEVFIAATAAFVVAVSLVVRALIVAVVVIFIVAVSFVVGSLVITVRVRAGICRRWFTGFFITTKIEEQT